MKKIIIIFNLLVLSSFLTQAREFPAPWNSSTMYNPGDMATMNINNITYIFTSQTTQNARDFQDPSATNWRAYWTVYYDGSALPWLPNAFYQSGTKVSKLINGSTYYFYCFQSNVSTDPCTTWSGFWSVVNQGAILPWLPNVFYKVDPSNPIRVSKIINGTTYFFDCIADNSNTEPQIATNTFAWKCTNCNNVAPICPNIYTTDYFPLSLAQKNNGIDGTNPPNESGNSGVVDNGSGDKFMNINQPRKCLTPLVLYNNELYLRDGCDPNQGLGYYGIAGNKNYPSPQKRLFADQDVDGPVLYGFSGGALGVRQRTKETINNATGPAIEKIALQWTPYNVTIGTSLLPINFHSFGNSSFYKNVTIGVSENQTSILSVSGSVGIGTLLPTSLLQVGEDVNSKLHDNSPFGVVITANSSKSGSEKAVLELHSKQAQSVLDIECTNWGSFIGNMNKAYPLFLQEQGGPVAIGTQRIPGDYKLVVNGAVLATSIDVLLYDKWPDYVFDKEYKLRSLKETEAFIAKNNHLPEVPSEAEIAQKGINVAQMNATLLKKVEELTLYMIEMQKQNEQLKAKVEKLEKAIH